MLVIWFKKNLVPLSLTLLALGSSGTLAQTNNDQSYPTRSEIGRAHGLNSSHLGISRMPSSA